MRFKRGVDESDGTDGINCGLPLFDLTWGFWVTCPHHKAILSAATIFNIFVGSFISLIRILGKGIRLQ